MSPFIYSLRVLDGRRDALITHLHWRSIDVGIHFVPVHRHTYFAQCRRSDMTVTDKVAAEVLRCPCIPT